MEKMKRTTCSNVVPPNTVRDMVDGQSASRGRGRSTDRGRDGATDRGFGQAAGKGSSRRSGRQVAQEFISRSPSPLLP
ncbi:hypothetical protein R1flu_011096 [Riccia fluitans]|uniref:Uncharacterized protein n=1 Tax=Riccia fluitans TaxID=41844 RepID=A0ABD1Z7X2_9MARC